MARMIANSLLITILILPLAFPSFANATETSQLSDGATAFTSDLRLFLSPDCQFLQTVIERSTSSSKSSLPDLMPNATCPFECCFAFDGLDSQRSRAATNYKDAKQSPGKNLIHWTRGRLNETINRATPIVVHFAKSAIRLATIAADNNSFSASPVNPLRKSRTRVQQISTPIEIGPPIIKPRYEKVLAPQETMDAYWQYYDDCDRWNVVFNRIEHNPVESLSIANGAISLTQVQPVRRILGSLHLTVTFIQRHVLSFQIDSVTQPVVKLWKAVEFRIVENTFVHLFSSAPTQSIAEEENRHQLK